MRDGSSAAYGVGPRLALQSLPAHTCGHLEDPRAAERLRNAGKRLTKAPKVCLRDSGLLHHLLNISTADELANHPARGASWEGFVIEDVLRRARLANPATQACFWRTAAGAEIDRLLDRGDARVAVEVKTGRGVRARAIRVLRESMPDADVGRGWIVDQAPGIERVSDSIARAGFGEIMRGRPQASANGFVGLRPSYPTQRHCCRCVETD